MDSDLRSIGELARASGLTVSALRFYDAAGVLVPAWVDPATGYRRYTDDQVAPARLVAGLRRVGMPVAEIARAVRAEPAVVHRLLDTHVRRLEEGLADARREVSRIRSLLPADQPSAVTRLTLTVAALAAAVDAVRFAVGTDPELPALTGVLFDVAETGVQLVATDRHRLAVATAEAAVHGPAVRTVLPLDAVDALRQLLTTATRGQADQDGADHGGAARGEVTLTVAGSSLVADVAGHRLRATALPDDFPDYHALLPRSGAAGPARRVPVDAEWLVTALRAGGPAAVRQYAGRSWPVTVLGLGTPDRLRLLGPDDLTGDDNPADPGDRTELRVGVNGAYLLDALGAAGRRHLTLEVDSPLTPLAIRRPDDEGAFSILMPIRL
ncbi:MerR family transcriptional regulator [Micromonospora zingiberis]|uniref:MerR family transcriptional regulator n=1 Tax=Micromonospora zingiberis TaxID=2053011 RepID=A0A4R0GGH2_9ACTN|nr:MerR family transcriptional regulator [Micromonospora zingiberis]TCB96484.1 MerR family transcriptional regulator [Micromonospora zingiberis]